MGKTKAFETPRGELEWIVIDGEGKPNLSGKLQYTANLVLNAEDVPVVEAILQEFWNDNKPEKFAKAPKSLGIYDHKVANGEVDENGKAIYVSSGKKYLAFKTGTSYQDGKPKVIKVLNSKNNPVVLGATKIGNGSIGRILGNMGIYINSVPNKPAQIIDAGVTLYLDQIKLLKLVEYSGGAEFSDEDSDFEPIGEEFLGTEEPAAAAATSRPKL